MELRCPQCGKWLAVSQEELVIHGSQVVCPQCLAVCRYEGDALVVKDDSDAPYRHTANADTVSHAHSKFCHSCGKQLPGGISFCPYCGADLSAPFEEPQPVNKVDKPQPAVEPAKAVEAPQPVKTEPAKPAASRPKRQSSSNHVEDKLRTMSRHYNNMHPQLHQNGTMPGRTFKIVAYAIIVLLLALLAFIIWAGISIDSGL